MRVKQRMTSNPITISPKASFNEAMRLMKDNAIHHLPVVEKNGTLIGILTHSDLLSAKPSEVTTLSVYEIASLLNRVTVSHIMSTPALAVDETCSLTSAARFMIENEIGCVPVLREGELVGIITDTDIFETFVEIMGGTKPGSHLELQMPDEKGQLAKVLSGLAAAGSLVVSVAVYYDTPEVAIVDIKERGGEETRLRAEIEKLPEVEVLEFRAPESDQLIHCG